MYETHVPDKATLQEVLALVNDNGAVHMGQGVVVASKEWLIGIAQGLPEHHDGKRVDFATAPYWVTTKWLEDPKPVHGVDDPNLIEGLTRRFYWDITPITMTYN